MKLSDIVFILGQSMMLTIAVLTLGLAIAGSGNIVILIVLALLSIIFFAISVHLYYRDK